MNTIEYFDKPMKNLQDDILDEYNQGKISKKEMTNIMEWITNMIEMKKRN